MSMKEKELNYIQEREGNSFQKFSKWFWKRYWKQALIFLVLFILSLCFIYFVFAFTTPIPAGTNLHRSDWLAFLGGVLTLVGSVVVSVISITQASYFNEMEKTRQEMQRNLDEVDKKQKRKEEIRPELVIVIKGRNLRIPYIDRWPSERLHKAMFNTELPEKYKEKNNFVTGEAAILENLHKEAMIKDYPVDNIWISITNIGKYPVKHMEVYGEYYFPFIRPGEFIDLVLTLDSYPRKTEAYQSIYGIGRINNSRSAVKIIDVKNEGIDSEKAHIEESKQYDRIWIDFEDIDGNNYQQVFRTHPSGVGNYFCNDELIENNQTKNGN